MLIKVQKIAKAEIILLRRELGESFHLHRSREKSFYTQKIVPNGEVASPSPHWLGKRSILLDQLPNMV